MWGENPAILESLIMMPLPVLLGFSYFPIFQTVGCYARSKSLESELAVGGHAPLRAGGPTHAKAGPDDKCLVLKTRFETWMLTN